MLGVRLAARRVLPLEGLAIAEHAIRLFRYHYLSFGEWLSSCTLFLLIISDHFLRLVLYERYLRDHLSCLAPVAALEGAEWLPRRRQVDVLGRSCW